MKPLPKKMPQPGVEPECWAPQAQRISITTLGQNKTVHSIQRMNVYPY
jgi:hypothetical protein